MVQVMTTSTPPEDASSSPFLTRVSLFPLSLFILAIGIVWRVVDIFVLGLGDTTLNILPSKLFPLMILVGIFWFYRRNEITSVLGLSRANIRTHVTIGAIIGVSIYLITVVLPRIVYGAMSGTPSMSVYIAYPDLLWYEFFFVFVNAIMEETLFRGLLYHGFQKITTSNRSILYAAVIFGLWHICWPFANGLQGAELISNIFVSVVFSGILGIFFSIYYVKFSGATTLSGTIVAHTLINFLNESFKIGTTPEMQGPDTPVSSSMLMLTALFFLVTITIAMILLSKYRIESVLTIPSRIREAILGRS